MLKASHTRSHFPGQQCTVCARPREFVLWTHSLMLFPIVTNKHQELYVRQRRHFGFRSKRAKLRRKQTPVEGHDCQSGGGSGPEASDAWTYDRDPPIFGKDRASSLTIISNPSCILATHLRKMTAYSFSSLPDHI